jgi:hypothetical protein
MVLPSPSKEVMNGVRAALGLDEVGMRQAVQLVKEWLKQQAHLPQEIGKYREPLMVPTHFCRSPIFHARRNHFSPTKHPPILPLIVTELHTP